MKVTFLRNDLFPSIERHYIEHSCVTGWYEKVGIQRWACITWCIIITPKYWFYWSKGYARKGMCRHSWNVLAILILNNCVFFQKISRCLFPVISSIINLSNSL